MEEHGINSATLIVYSVKSRDSITWSQDSTGIIRVLNYPIFKLTWPPHAVRNFPPTHPYDRQGGFRLFDDCGYSPTFAGNDFDCLMFFGVKS